jgi:hypothetical protein
MGDFLILDPLEAHGMNRANDENSDDKMVEGIGHRIVDLPSFYSWLFSALYHRLIPRILASEVAVFSFEGSHIPTEISGEVKTKKRKGFPSLTLRFICQ